MRMFQRTPWSAPESLPSWRCLAARKACRRRAAASTWGSGAAWEPCGVGAVNGGRRSRGGRWAAARGTPHAGDGSREQSTRARPRPAARRWVFAHDIPRDMSTRRNESLLTLPAARDETPRSIKKRRPAMVTMRATRDRAIATVALLLALAPRLAAQPATAGVPVAMPHLAEELNP